MSINESNRMNIRTATTKKARELDYSSGVRELERNYLLVNDMLSEERSKSAKLAGEMNILRDSIAVSSKEVPTPVRKKSLKAGELSAYTHDDVRGAWVKDDSGTHLDVSVGGSPVALDGSMTLTKEQMRSVSLVMLAMSTPTPA